MWEWWLSLSMFSFLCEIRASEGVSDHRPTFNLLARSGGLVVATPWDANMDAEQKLKGRVSVDDGNNCTVSATHRGWLAVSLPVHILHRKIAKAATIERRQSTYKAVSVAE